jgi:hypothetical protein
VTKAAQYVTLRGPNRRETMHIANMLILSSLVAQTLIDETPDEMADMPPLMSSGGPAPHRPAKHRDTKPKVKPKKKTKLGRRDHRRRR